MSIVLSRRSVCAFAPAAAVALSAPHVVAAPDDSHLLDLCRRHVEMDPVLADLWERYVEAWHRTIAVIGECPRSDEGNAAWWDRYRETDAWTTGGEHEDAAARQCGYMDEIVRLEAQTIAGIAAKLDLWRRTDKVFVGGNDELWESLADDLETMCGFRIAEAVAP